MVDKKELEELNYEQTMEKRKTLNELLKVRTNFSCLCFI